MEVRVLYLCDGHACEAPGFCARNGTGECRHTTDFAHAMHKDADLNDFMRVREQDGVTLLVEPSDD